jgi:hypothetical protein
MKVKWEVDDATTVEARMGGFGKEVVTVNGTEVIRRRNLRMKGGLPFALPDGRQAAISVEGQFVGQALVQLRVDGHLITETGKEPIKCSACGSAAKPYDRFCQSCGHAMPTAEEYVHQRHVKGATGAIKALAIMFSIFGAIMYFATKTQADLVLAKLSNMDPNMTLPTPINGQTYTVAALRHEVLWEPWSVLIVNLVLAAVMVGLAIWGRRAPLAAVLVATATYAVVIVANAIMDPMTIGQGIYMKIIIIAILVKGIKSALALRSAKI